MTSRRSHQRVPVSSLAQYTSFHASVDPPNCVGGSSADSATNDWPIAHLAQVLPTTASTWIFSLDLHPATSPTSRQTTSAVAAFRAEHWIIGVLPFRWHLPPE